MREAAEEMLSSAEPELDYPSSYRFLSVLELLSYFCFNGLDTLDTFEWIDSASFSM